MQLKCPLCEKVFIGLDALKAHVWSPRHKLGIEILDKVDALELNLREAERAVDIYRSLAREDKNAYQ